MQRRGPVDNRSDSEKAARKAELAAQYERAAAKRRAQPHARKAKRTKPAIQDRFIYGIKRVSSGGLPGLGKKK
jgi:hypothetical protein